MTKQGFTDNVNRISKINAKELTVLYEQYSAWARHLHTLVWVSTTFGIGIALAGLTFFSQLEELEFTTLGIGCITILYLSFRVAEGNAKQVQSHWLLLNAIEAKWNLRDKDNLSGPPLGQVPGQTKGGTKAARITLTSACIVLWGVAVAVKTLIP